jgi:uncharacterized circularly permuted ATP-grasp superfamily protein
MKKGYVKLFEEFIDADYDMQRIIKDQKMPNWLILNKQKRQSPQEKV